MSIFTLQSVVSLARIRPFLIKNKRRKRSKRRRRRKRSKRRKKRKGREGRKVMQIGIFLEAIKFSCTV